MIKWLLLSESFSCLLGFLAQESDNRLKKDTKCRLSKHT